MTHCYARYLPLLAWVAALVSPLLIAPTAAQIANADLADLAVQPAYIYEPFDKDTTAYSAVTTSSTDTATVYATAASSNASIQYTDGNDAAIADGNGAVAGHQVTLASGSNTVKVVVTHGSATKTYTLTIHRAASSTITGATTSYDGVWYGSGSTYNGEINTASLSATASAPSLEVTYSGSDAQNQLDTNYYSNLRFYTCISRAVNRNTVVGDAACTNHGTPTRHNALRGTRAITLTAAMAGNGGVVVKIWHNGTSDVKAAKWVPITLANFVDYDTDDNRLIEIRNLAQLNALRYDLDGNGTVAVGDTANYNAAFPSRMSGMGCPSSCTGYELMANLTFPTTWTPIDNFNTTFDGNGHTLTGLSVTRNNQNAGMFGSLSSNGLIKNLGLINPSVTQTVTFDRVGALVGDLNSGARIHSCYVLGGNVTVTGGQNSYVGGLTGENSGTIRASYSTATISASGNTSSTSLGGLVGTNQGTIIASYAVGPVSITGTGANNNTGGLAGHAEGGNSAITNSYCDTDASGQTNCIGFRFNTSVTAAGYSTRDLQMPTGYTGIYSAWNVNVDGMAGNDDPWDFGAADQYPVLKFGRDAATIAAQFAVQPLSQVRGVSVTPSGLSALVVSWTAASNAEGYKVQWKSGGENYAADRQAVVTDGVTHTIANLTADMEYAVRVIATHTGFDDGPASDEATVRLELGKVSGVQVAPGPGGVVVSWTAAPGATGYKVQWKSGDEGYDAADRQAVATGTTYIIPNLRADTEYTVRVIATHTSAADGPASDEASETPAPPKVSGVQATPGEEVLIVSWTAVPGATGYKVQWKSGDEDYDTAERQAVVTDGATVTIANLLVATEYTVRVIATFANADDELASDEVTGIPRELNTTPIFIDAVDVQRYQQGTEIDPLTLPTPIDGNGTLTYRLTALPEGLVFDAETLVISGTPLEAMDATTYTLTATDEDGDKGTLQFILVIIADRMSSFGDTTVTTPVYVQNRAIDPLTLPQAIGGDGTLTYALTPDLPEGLNFDAETLVISGMPLEAMDATTYTLTATDEDGDESLLTFTLEVMADLMPTFGDTTVATQSYTVNREIESLMLPPATSGDGTLAYFLLPFLPDGLSFDPATRTIAGTPTEAMDETTYTLTALDADGDLASLTFTLDVQMPSPDFNGDGNVNFADFILFAGKFGSRLGQDRYDARCDLNGDGQIDFADFLIFAANFGVVG